MLLEDLAVEEKDGHRAGVKSSHQRGLVPESEDR
jgi:hypothetical protein